MATIVTRAGKGSPLTHNEVDANFTNLNSDKAELASPTFTGTPAAPTATVGTNTTQVATTAFVNAEIANDAPTKTGTGASGTWGISISGNAATATSATTASSATTTNQIGGIGFRNTGSNSAVNADTLDSNGVTYYTAGVPNFTGNATDGALYSQAWSSSWQHQIAGDYRSGQIALRGKNNGTFQSWRTVLDSSNYTSYSPSLTGSGASGTWAISISGDAASVDGKSFGTFTAAGGVAYATDTSTLAATAAGTSGQVLQSNGASAPSWVTPSGIPAGAVAAFAMNTAPTGWLKANGAAVSRSTYATLFTAIGTTFGVGDGSTTFNLPDLRGEFIRGWDDSRGIDSGRSFGSAQTDAFQGHFHQSQTGNNSTAGGNYTIGSTAFSTTNNLVKGAITDATYGTARIASETRPRSIALLACIKF